MGRTEAGSMPRAVNLASSWEAATVPESMPRSMKVASSWEAATVPGSMPRAVKVASSWEAATVPGRCPRAMKLASSWEAAKAGGDAPAVKVACRGRRRPCRGRCPGREGRLVVGGGNCRRRDPAGREARLLMVRGRRRRCAAHRRRGGDAQNDRSLANPAAFDVGPARSRVSSAASNENVIASSVRILENGLEVGALPGDRNRTPLGRLSRSSAGCRVPTRSEDRKLAPPRSRREDGDRQPVGLRGEHWRGVDKHRACARPVHTCSFLRATPNGAHAF